MPKRIKSHVTGDIAVAHVTRVFNECGWACESIEKDYGEDLFVQTCHNDEIDHFKIWVQVKGTENIERFKSKKYGYSLSVSFEHAIKWIRSLDLVLAILYDVRQNYGLYSLPKWCINQWNLYMLEEKKSRLLFPEKWIFNVDSAVEIRWRACIDYYTTLLNNAINHDAKYLRQGENSEKIEKRSHQRIILLTFDILRGLGIIGDDRIDPTFVDYYKNALENISADMKNDSINQVNQTASLLAFMGKLDDLAPGVGATSEIMEECSKASLQWLAGLSETDSSEWQEICKIIEQIQK